MAEFKPDTYTPTGLMYPNDLMGEGNPYGNTYVIFYINVHEDSLILKETGGNEAVVAGATLGMRTNNSGLPISSATIKTEAKLATAAAINAAGITEKMSFGAVKGMPAVAANFVGGFVTGDAMVDMIGNVKPQYKQLKKTIALHMPADLNIKYGVNWSETSLAGTEALMAMGENIKPILDKSNMSDAADSVKGAVGAALKTGTGYLAGLGLQTPGIGEYVSKSSGTAANPKKEQLFKDVDFRTFNFSYQFFPRSPEEAKNVQNIIREFKLHMHPEFKKDSNNFLYIYPSEFDIKYYVNNEENPFLFKHTSCVLTDMSVSYSPQGNFVSFADGMPVQININLTFKELALLSKETILEGF